MNTLNNMVAAVLMTKVFEPSYVLQQQTHLYLPEANELRTALLQAVSHDPRTPLASMCAANSPMV
jgi:K+-sensing histidine kinase KdpD